MTSVTEFNAIFVTQKCHVLRCNSLSMVACVAGEVSLAGALAAEPQAPQLDSSPFFSRRAAFFLPLAFETSELTRENSASYAGYKHGGFQYQLFSLLSRRTAFVYKRTTLSEYGTSQIVGNVPLTLSHVFHLFLKHRGQIAVEVTGKRRNKGIGLEIPATYSFYHKHTIVPMSMTYNKPLTERLLSLYHKD